MSATLPSLRDRHGIARRLLAAFALAAASLAPAVAGEFLDPEAAFKVEATPLDAQRVELKFIAAPGYHLYRERLGVETEPASTAALDTPAGRREYDKALEREVETYAGTTRATATLAAAPSAPFKLIVQLQGCADEGLCYPPGQRAFRAERSGAGFVLTALSEEQAAAWNPGAAAAGKATTATAPATTATAGSTATRSDDSPGRFAGALQSKSLVTVAAVFLVAGLLLSFTPCVLPMIPILSSIIVGDSAQVSRGRGFALASAYSLGMALVYTAAGMAAGLMGEGLAAALQNAWVLGAFALMLVAFSLSMFGVYELQMPSAIQSRVTEASGRLQGGRLGGVFLMGGLSALIVGPCVAAPLAGALVYISQTRDVALGGVALFSLASGMSVPLLLVGLSAGSLLPRAGVWMENVKRFFGVMLLAVALWIVQPVLPGWAVMAILGIGALVGAVLLRLLERPAPEAPTHQRLARGIALVLAVVGATQLVGVLSGGSDPVQPLKHLARAGSSTAVAAESTAPAFRRVRTVAELDAALQTAGRPVVLDFYADWCVSCKEMEHATFKDSAVRASFGKALLLQADVTANTEHDRALLKRFGLFGPPGVLLFGADGRERADSRVIGFVPPERFREALATVGL